MATIEQRLTEMLRDPVEALGFELWGIEFIRAGKHSILRVYIDHENGIDVDNCADVSHQVSAVLDVEDPINTEYYLEVSSPGMDRPLFHPEQYGRYIGEQLKLRLRLAVSGRRKMTGILEAAEEHDIRVNVDGETLSVRYDNIDKANLVPSF